MPLEAPGRRHEAVATKACSHNDPVVENNFAGIAAKSAQIAAMAPSVANAALAVQISIGESFIIMLDGLHEVDVAKLPGGYAVGDQLWIHPADNTLHETATKAAGDVKFGVISSIDATLGRAYVNLTQRSSF